MESAGILAGPILRRVDTESVTFWVATNRPVRMDSAIYRLENIFPHRTTTTLKTIKAGHRLFIHLLQVRGQYPTDTLLGYDLLFRNGKKTYNLASLSLNTKNEGSIPFDGLLYPSFFIPASATPIFLYAFCRNFPRKGDDAIVAEDTLLQESARNVFKLGQ
ncbi:hypothetical protein [Sporosarcina highlanderae]|uniref:Uncharacterized protein n=1 Tax=Sporosarcina highlanderae TaxID=3035916 RepID=A0ABT8JNK5_9BACL|nr:hypothetical protein [Sporosarcina highlanderae]MDN4606627.1 hypothetical protein [Sporosarcina highlanderae]